MPAAAAPDDAPRRLRTLRKAAEEYGLNPYTLRRWIKDGLISSYRVGPSLVMVDLDELGGARGPPDQRRPRRGREVTARTAPAPMRPAPRSPARRAGASSPAAGPGPGDRGPAVPVVRACVRRGLAGVPLRARDDHRPPARGGARPWRSLTRRRAGPSGPAVATGPPAESHHPPPPQRRGIRCCQRPAGTGSGRGAPGATARCLPAAPVLHRRVPPQRAEGRAVIEDDSYAAGVVRLIRTMGVRASADVEALRWLAARWSMPAARSPWRWTAAVPWLLRRRDRGRPRITRQAVWKRFPRQPKVDAGTPESGAAP